MQKYLVPTVERNFSFNMHIIFTACSFRFKPDEQTHALYVQCKIHRAVYMRLSVLIALYY